jgi:hypothetical protein
MSIFCAQNAAPYTVLPMAAAPGPFPPQLLKKPLFAVVKSKEIVIRRTSQRFSQNQQGIYYSWWPKIIHVAINFIQVE